jgi:hypothetical protein
VSSICSTIAGSIAGFWNGHCRRRKAHVPASRSLQTVPHGGGRLQLPANLVSEERWNHSQRP